MYRHVYITEQKYILHCHFGIYIAEIRCQVRECTFYLWQVQCSSSCSWLCGSEHPRHRWGSHSRSRFHWDPWRHPQYKDPRLRPPSRTPCKSFRCRLSTPPGPELLDTLSPLATNTQERTTVSRIWRQTAYNLAFWKKLNRHRSAFCCVYEQAKTFASPKKQHFICDLHKI